MASSSSAEAQQRRAMAEHPMAKTFWGVEVKPDEPYVHRGGGGLFIRQATIGNNSDTMGLTFLAIKSEKTGVIRLCALNSVDSVSYELNIHLLGDVVLSVTGDSSVHVWGHCIHPPHDGSLAKNTTIRSHQEYERTGSSEKNGGETSKRPIIIEEEDNKDDDHLSDPRRRANNNKKKCNTPSNAKVPSEKMDDSKPVNEQNHSTNRNEGDLSTNNVEIQDVRRQSSVARGSGGERGGKVGAHHPELTIKYLERGRASSKIASKGSKVTVKYVGKFLDGRIADPLDVLKFKLGDGSVIVGFDQGIHGMRVGDKRSLSIPPDFGYGAEWSPDGRIPPNSWLEYEVELTNVKGGPELDFVKREN